MIGCGDPTAVCEYNFNFDGVNEAGEEFNTNTFENLVNYQACAVNLNACKYLHYYTVRGKHFNNRVRCSHEEKKTKCNQFTNTKRLT